jgi:hypothetical protein
LLRPEEVVMVIFCSLPVARSLRRDVQDAVGVNVEGHLDLGHAARRGRNAHQLEDAQQAVVGRHGALALVNLDLHRGLVVGRGRENLALARGNGGVALDQHGVNPAQGLDPQRQRRHVQQEHILDLAAQHAALDGRAHRHHLVRVHAPVRILAEEVAHQLDDARRARGPAHQHHLVNLRGREVGVRQGLLDRAEAALDQILHHLLVARPGQLHHQVLGAGGVGRDEGQVDLGLKQRRKLDLGLLGRLLQALQRHLVARQVNAVFLLELGHDPVNDALVHVVAAQVGVAVGGLDLDQPSPTSRIEMSKVPPPKSYTAIVSFFFLSKP